MPKFTPEEVARQMAATAEAIVKLRSSYRVELHLSREFKVDVRTARRWMAKVRADWRSKATLTDRDQRRDEARATLTEIIVLALTRTIFVKDAEGGIVYATERVQDASGETVERRKLSKEGFPIPMTRPNPDLQRALHAQAQLRALDALDEPFTAKLQLVEGLKNLPDVKNLDADGYETLKQLITRMAPNMDLRQLAGSMFIDPASKKDVN